MQGAERGELNQEPSNAESGARKSQNQPEKHRLGSAPKAFRGKKIGQFVVSNNESDVGVIAFLQQHAGTPIVIGEMGGFYTDKDRIWQDWAFAFILYISITLIPPPSDLALFMYILLTLRVSRYHSRVIYSTGSPSLPARRLAGSRRPSGGWMCCI